MAILTPLSNLLSSSTRLYIKKNPPKINQVCPSSFICHTLVTYVSVLGAE